MDVPEEIVSPNMDMTIFDEVIKVETPDANRTARDIAKTEGILVGSSAGAAVYAAKELALRPENKGKKIVAILPDTGLRYLSTSLFD